MPRGVLCGDPDGEGSDLNSCIIGFLARPLRLELAGAVYHVTARGNDRNLIFRDDEDRRVYLGRLAHYGRRFSVRILAYCLMPNHVHLALRRGCFPLSRFMAGLQSSYTQWFNRRHRKSGHLFQGRYKAFLVQEDPYLLALVRYIHLNPVKAGLAATPESYAWSSDRHYRRSPAPDWLDSSQVLEMLRSTRRLAARGYLQLMSGEQGRPYEDVPSVAQLVKGEEPYALERFEEAGIEESFLPGLTPERVLKAVAEELKLDLAELQGPGRSRRMSEGRAVAGYLGKTLGRIPWSRMARRVHRDGSTLVRDVGRLEERLRDDSRLLRRIGAISRALGATRK